MIPIEITGKPAKKTHNGFLKTRATLLCPVNLFNVSLSLFM